MPTVTRTIHPLPFEHLEPRRFEDLIRQLAYDFRRWRSLEALGQAGADAGFDARAFEIVEGAAADDLEEDPENESVADASDRVWLIQCKREHSIGPAKLQQHLDEIPPTSIAGLHGMILAAPCRFSKATSDAFKNWCRARGVQECYLWGRPEIEDALYQPKNDHLLFAYFGFSLQMRRRQQASSLKRVISLKRTLNRLFPQDTSFGKPAVLRDPQDDRYPFVESARFEDDKPLWLPTLIMGVGRLGLRVALRRYLAYYSYDDGTWDAATKINQAIPIHRDNPWYDLQFPPEDRETHDGLIQDWWSLRDVNQYHLMFVGHIPYDDIIAIDDIGDDHLRSPTVFMTFNESKPPFDKRWDLYFHPSSSFSSNIEFHKEGHIRVFPDRFRDLEWERGWFQRNEIPYATTLAEVRRNTQGVSK